MSSFTRFSSQLDLRYHSESVWEVLTPFSYDVSEVGSGITVDIPKGFLFDGGSVPKSLWSIISPWEENCGQAFCVHDKLCVEQMLTYHQDSGKIVKVNITRKRCDEILEEALNVLKVTPRKIDLIMAGVNLHRVVNGIE